MNFFCIRNMLSTGDNEVNKWYLICVCQDLINIWENCELIIRVITSRIMIRVLIERFLSGRHHEKYNYENYSDIFGKPNINCNHVNPCSFWNSIIFINTILIFNIFSCFSFFCFLVTFTQEIYIWPLESKSGSSFPPPCDFQIFQQQHSVFSLKEVDSQI